jgi:lysophospholipase L1-like esterase
MTFASMKYLIRWMSGAAVGAFALFGLFAAPAAGQYASQVARWVAQDTADPLPTDGIVFAGSSSIRRWEELTLDFADYNVVQRGLGGATFATYQPHVNDAIIAHSPRAVVVWLGTNDIAGGLSGNGVVSAFNTFASTIHGSLPNTEIFYLGIMPTPGRQGNRGQEDVANAGIAAVAAGDSHIHYIDLPAVFDGLGAYNGADFTNKFVDSIHLNRDGYDVWESVIRPAIEAEFAPDKVYTPNPKTLKPGERLLVDFGPSNTDDGGITASPDANGNYWSNWTGAIGGVRAIAGEHQRGLVNTAGNDTGIGITITAEFDSNGKLNGGLFNPDPNLLGDLAVESATVDFFFSTGDGKQGGGDDDMAGGFMLDGLDPNLSYDFKFFGSRTTTETRITEYTVTGANSQSVLLQTSGTNIGSNGSYDGNDDELAKVTGVRPDAFGQIFVDLTLIQGSFAYINAMEVTATPEPSTLLLALTCVTGLGLFNRRVRWNRAAR